MVLKKYIDSVPKTIMYFLANHVNEGGGRHRTEEEDVRREMRDSNSFAK